MMNNNKMKELKQKRNKAFLAMLISFIITVTFIFIRLFVTAESPAIILVMNGIAFPVAVASCALLVLSAIAFILFINEINKRK